MAEQAAIYLWFLKCPVQFWRTLFWREPCLVAQSNGEARQGGHS